MMWMSAPVQSKSDVLVVGGGLAGIVTALECLRAGLHVTVVDRDTWAREAIEADDVPYRALLGLADLGLAG